jgi:hypothetical protein
METIKPTYTTFEQSKLLKEKGFNIICKQRYWEGYENIFHFQDSCILNNWNNYDDSSTIYFSAPEQWQVVEWLRINHGIWASPGIINLNGVVKWFPICFKFVNGLLEIRKDIDGNFDTPQEAYSAAFDYILTNNLI